MQRKGAVRRDRAKEKTAIIGNDKEKKAELRQSADPMSCGRARRRVGIVKNAGRRMCEE